jgi:7 transmembrane sweet-taste receptor of 3 GCPR
MTICFLILILWTALDPWTWERDVIKEIPPESYGKCTSRYFWAWFGPLIGLLFFAEGLTWYFAWKTADIPDDFRDSGAVMCASFAQMQSWAFGIPMLAVLGNSSSEATYFGRICLIWIFSVSSVVVVVGPKLISAFRIRRNPALGQKKDRVRVTGLTTPIASHQSSQILLDTRSRNSLDSGNRSSD